MIENDNGLIGRYAPESAAKPIGDLASDASHELLEIIKWQFGVAGVRSCDREAFEEFVYSLVRRSGDIMFSACQNREFQRSREETGNLLGLVVESTLGNLGAPKEVGESVAKSLKVRLDLEDPEDELGGQK